MNYRILWSFIILAVVMWGTVLALPFSVLPIENIANRLNHVIDMNSLNVMQDRFGDHIQGNPKVFLAGIISYGMPALILWICLGMLYYNLLKER